MTGCPRCGGNEHPTRIESLACVEVNGGPMAKWSAPDRIDLFMRRDDDWLNALAAALEATDLWHTPVVPFRVRAVDR